VFLAGIYAMQKSLEKVMTLADFDRESMLEMFSYEMAQLVEQLEQTIIQAEAGYAIEQINEIFRIMHTIKGAAAMMLFENIATSAHAIEDLFYFLREENPTDVDYSTLTDFVLEGMDFIKGELDKIEQGLPNNGDGTETNLKINAYLKQLKGIGSEPADSGGGSSSTPGFGESGDVSAGNYARYKAVVFFDIGCEMENIRAYTMLHNLGSQITRIIHTPENIIDESSIELIRANGFNFECDSKLSYDELHAQLMETIFLRELSLEVVRPAQPAAAQPTPAASPAPAPVESGVARYEAFIRFEENAEMENVRAYAFIHNLEDYSFDIVHIPTDIVSETSIEDIRSHGFRVEFSSDKSYDQIYSILKNTIYLRELSLSVVDTGVSAEPSGRIATAAYDDSVVVKATDVAAVSEPEPEPIPVSKPEPAQAPEPATTTYDQPAAAKNPADMEAKMDTALMSVGAVDQPAKKAATQSVISVSVSKLDQLLNLMGELVIAESMVTQNKDLGNLELESFYKEALQLRKIISDVQDNVMSMRMIQLSATFFKMHRIVRDMCKQLNKDVELKIIGEETEVDKNIIEHIADPLMHIIRNSIDHGIELPENRAGKGKPRKGTVTLEAKNSGGDVLIIVSDDGAGLNREKIIAKARQNGLLRKHDSEYTDKEAYQFIFLPGFSTNENVTSYSGRGVGMDVVSTNLEIVGGSVIVDSIPGEGSKFTLKIPLTLAIIDGMIVKLGDAKYTIPIISIQQSFKAKQENIFTDPSGNEMIMIRGEVYNLIRLYEFFNVESATTNIEDGIIIMIENGEQTICILVDELIGQQPIVVKTLPKYFKKIRGISTCTLLGNGDISLIIDPVGFFDK